MLLIKGLIHFGALVILVTGLFKFDPVSKPNVLACCNLWVGGWAGVSECVAVAWGFVLTGNCVVLLRAVAMTTLLALAYSLKGLWSGGCYASVVRSMFFCVCVTVFVNSGTRRFSKCDKPHMGKPLALLWSGPLLLAQGAMRWCPHTWLLPLSAMALPLLLNATSAKSDTQNQRPIWCHQRPHSRIPSDIWTYTHQMQTFNPNPHRALVLRNRPLLCSKILTSRPSFPSDTGSDLYQSDI